MNEFLNGITFMGALTSSMFFYKFWKSTKDRFFLLFSIAFFIFSLNRVALTYLDPSNENRLLFYILRALAFIIIIFAIIHKNRKAKY